MKTQINIFIVLYILALHYYIDGILKVSKTPKKDDSLLNRSFNYGFAMWFGIIVLTGANVVIIGDEESMWPILPQLFFSVIAFLGYFIQNYFSLKTSKILWDSYTIRQFFVLIRENQIFLIILLLLAYQLILSKTIACVK